MYKILSRLSSVFWWAALYMVRKSTIVYRFTPLIRAGIIARRWHQHA